MKTIGIFSPSAAALHYFPVRASRGVAYLKSKGYNIVFANHAKEADGYVSSCISNRIDDLYQLLDNEKVDVIMSSIGGNNSNQLLRKLDYARIAKANKVFCGYSDVTALLLAIYAKTKQTVVYGPSFLPEMCEFPAVYDYTFQYFEKAVSGQAMDYQPSKYHINEFKDWSEEEKHAPTAKKQDSPTAWKVLNCGKAQGKIIGGNLTTMLKMLGSEFLPLQLLQNCVLFIEEAESQAAVIDANLYVLKNHGVFDIISGLIVGRFTQLPLTQHFESRIKDIVGKDIPILYNADFGHIDPKVSIPIGRDCLLELTASAITWKVN